MSDVSTNRDRRRLRRVGSARERLAGLEERLQIAEDEAPPAADSRDLAGDLRRGLWCALELVRDRQRRDATLTGFDLPRQAREAFRDHLRIPDALLARARAHIIQPLKPLMIVQRLVLAGLLLSALAIRAETGWTSLWNGSDFDGWTTWMRQPEPSS